ncbi:MAG TPA: class I SAM-dependent methyltransferase [Gaiellaceae bacterium]|nr:class I SAM-dependent methyltransferase [Gaiellaceae bacterium]
MILTLGPSLTSGDAVLDLACGDGGLADFLPEQRYLGVDGNAGMVAAGRSHGRELVEADMNDFRPLKPVDATTMFRGLYYARDRRELFAHIAGYTTKKLVFDFNPREFRVDDVLTDLRAAGFGEIETRPFFVPQTRALPRPVLAALRRVERTPGAGLLLRRASPSSAPRHPRATCRGRA